MSRSTRRGAPRVDEANQCIWWGDRRVDLAPKAFLVLQRLLRQPDQMVIKGDLLDAAWPDTHVGDAVLTVAINQLRDAFGDDSRQPRFIETVHRRGYRWIGAQDCLGRAETSSAGTGDFPTPAAPFVDSRTAQLVVGRQAALAQLEQVLKRAAGGSRETVIVIGEPGIGKSTVLDAFVARLAAGGAHGPQPVLLARGQCVDGYGTSDAYMPLLEALGRLCRQSTNGDAAALLRRLAPTWLLQLPQLLEPGERDALRRSLAGSSDARMIHELLCFVEELTLGRTLVLLLEDLHWSDHATIGALAALAARREPAQLMIVASYRPADAIAQLHPVTRWKHELASKRQCRDIVLEGLESDAVAAYLAGRFPNHRLPTELAAQLQAQTSGNPLFMLNALEDFVQRGWLKERGGVWECTVDLAMLAGAVPDGTREMIAFRLQQLSAVDLDLLEAASVVGTSFVAQALAAALERQPADVEIDCKRLARSAQFLDEGRSAMWPDGSAGVQHAFRHALYQQVLYGRVTPVRRQLWHRRVAECLEKGFADEAMTIAPQLALHFERGGDFRRAAEYRRKAGRQALGRFAYDQAIEHLRAGLAIVRSFPEGGERDAQELALQSDLLAPLYAVAGSSSSVLADVIERIHALSSSAASTPELFRALGTLVNAHCTRGEMRAARSVSEQLVERAGGEIGATLAGGLLGFCQLMQGEIAAGTEKLERSSELPAMLGASPLDPGIAAASDAALGLCLLGHSLRARALLGAAMQRANTSKHPATITHVALGGIRNGVVLLDDLLVEESTTTLTSLPQLQERWTAWSQVATGWLDIRRGRDGGTDRIRRAQDTLFRAGMRGYQSLFAAMAATGLLRDARHEEADALLTEGLTLVSETGECWCEAELHRLRGEVRLAQAMQQRRATTKRQELVGDAEACFARALEIARAQGAKWWELRTAVTLARLLRDRDRAGEARELLRSAYDGFDEGVDLPDLRAVQELLKSLPSAPHARTC